jgi:hypothetical protein
MVRLSVYYRRIVVAKYHGRGPAAGIEFYDHPFGSVLWKVRAKASVICGSDSVSAVASLNLIFKPLHKKKKFICYVMNRALLCCL